MVVKIVATKNGTTTRKKARTKLARITRNQRMIFPVRRTFGIQSPKSETRVPAAFCRLPPAYDLVSRTGSHSMVAGSVICVVSSSATTAAISAESEVTAK